LGKRCLQTPSKDKKAIIYKENDFEFISEIKNLTFQYLKYQLGFFWISQIRCGFKFDISISIKLRASTVEMIRYGFSLPGERSDIDLFDNTNIEIITCNNGCGVIIDE